MNQGSAPPDIDRLPDDRCDDVLQDAELDVEHPLPDQVDDRDRQDERQEERGEDDALHPAARRLTISAMPSAAAVPGTTVSSDEIGGVPDGGPEHPVARTSRVVVVEADPVARPDQRRIGEAQPHHLDGRVDEQPAVDRDEGRNQHHRDEYLGAPALQHRSRRLAGKARPTAPLTAPAGVSRRERYLRASSAAFISVDRVLPDPPRR